MQKVLADAHKTLIWMVWLNIALDLLSIPLWIALSFIQNPITSTNIPAADAIIALTDAAIATIIFAIALFGLMRKQKWGAYLAIAATTGQRVLGLFIYPLNGLMLLEFVWSILIVFFAYKTLTQTKKP